MAGGADRVRAGQVMRDPVVAADGHTYERAGAERWFAQHGAVSMVTGAPLPHVHLVPNQASRSSLVTTWPHPAFQTPPGPLRYHPHASRILSFHPLYPASQIPPPPSPRALASMPAQDLQ
jgi:hypothetical protein